MGIQEDIIELRSLTQITGEVCSAQTYQLSKWPQIILPQVIAPADLEIDLDEKHVGFLVFTTNQVKTSKKELDEYYQVLWNWTKYLLGDNWTISIRTGPDLLFDSRTI